MAATELNDRLDYLISYSSQLVFVCSDKIQQQSQVIESFLTQQNEQADLALLTANELTPLVIYREKLFRQLVSQTQDADFNRPLNQLLAPLNNQSGSILINIFQAEKLPNKLVKELWDLVLQSRFAGNKQHLNVLLMGLSDWAESVKSGLGAKSKGQPIVLNSQIEIQHTETHEFSDLESFIQDKRKKFAQRIEQRHEQSYVSQPIYKKWWVAALFGLFFLGVFVGMLGWQYPEKMKAMLPTFNIEAQGAMQEELVTPSNDIELVAEPALTIQATPEPIKELVIPITTSIDNDDSSTKDILVTDWQTASAKLNVDSNEVIIQNSKTDEAVNSPTSLPPESESVTSTPVKNMNTAIGTVNDYQVEDIVEVSPLITRIEPQQGNASQALQNDNPLNLEAEMLLALPNNNFVIQIAAMANINIMQDYIKDQQLGQKLWLYKTQRYGGDWYVLLKNQYFPTIEDARAGITHLTNAILNNTPFVKSIRQVKQEITVSKP